MLGPTASSKSDVALGLAEQTRGEIVSVDSMQVYRGMDIGTAKPDAATRARIPHHLIDIVEPEDEFTAAEFQEAGRSALAGLPADAVTVIAGGSGLHFRALVDPMTFAPSDPEIRTELESSGPADLAVELLRADPGAGAVVDLANPRRVMRAVEIHRLTGLTPTERAATPEYSRLAAYEPLIPFTAVGFDPGDRLSDRVEERFGAMLERGLLDEVRDLAPRLGRTARQAVGYKELIPVIAGEASADEGREAAIRATLALAKRQRTYFRRDPRIAWIPWHDDPGVRLERALAALEASL